MTPTQIAEAQRLARDAYDRGDYGTALRELRPVAEQGEPFAQHRLGFMYANGRGVPQDYPEALRWYRLAAEQGFAFAQNNLGFMYDNGHGTLPNCVEAHKWFNLAATKGNENAGKNRDIVAKLMTPAQIAEAQRLAREWTEKHQK